MVGVWEKDDFAFHHDSTNAPIIKYEGWWAIIALMDPKAPVVKVKDHDSYWTASCAYACGNIWNYHNDQYPKMGTENLLSFGAGTADSVKFNLQCGPRVMSRRGNNFLIVAWYADAESDQFEKLGNC